MCVCVRLTLLTWRDAAAKLSCLPEQPQKFPHLSRKQTQTKHQGKPRTQAGPFAPKCRWLGHAGTMYGKYLCQIMQSWKPLEPESFGHPEVGCFTPRLCTSWAEGALRRSIAPEYKADKQPNSFGIPWNSMS